jgi:hypothetical protein
MDQVCRNTGEEFAHRNIGQARLVSIVCGGTDFLLMNLLILVRVSVNNLELRRRVV